MAKVFFHEDGSASPNPPTRDIARRLRRPRYDDRAVCPTCDACSIKFTATGTCIHCARLAAIEFYNAAVLGKPPAGPITEDMKRALAALPDADRAAFPRSNAEAAARGVDVWVRVDACSRAGHYGLRTAAGECWYCAQDLEPKRRRAEARNAGELYYTPPEPCPACRAQAPRRVRDDTCTACTPARTESPRQAALAAGETWYNPTTACPRCETLAPRRVADGRCQGCHPPARRDTLAAPEGVVVTRGDARLLGFTTYYTGRPCKHGHDAPRYVSTGGCFECLRSLRGHARY